MKPKRSFRQRTAAEIREAAAKLCERLGEDNYHGYFGCFVAHRIRRIPLAGRFKAK